MTGQTGKTVRKLTRAATRRRDFVVVAALLSMACGSARAVTPEWHSTDDIAATAESFLISHMGSSATETDVAATQFDARHRLARCDRPLEGFLRRGMQIRARTIVGVRCTGKRPWKVYVPVDVIVTSTVLVSRRALPRGHVLSTDDVRPERRDVSRLRQGYLGDLSELQGQRLKAPLLAGKVLTPALFEIDRVVRRGQSVTLVAAVGTMAVNMSGTALADGGINQRIRVENTHSGRIVEGIVRSREHVEVLIPGQTPFFHARPKESPRVADTGSSNNDR